MKMTQPFSTWLNRVCWRASNRWKPPETPQQQTPGGQPWRPTLDLYMSVKDKNTTWSMPCHLPSLTALLMDWNIQIYNKRWYCFWLTPGNFSQPGLFILRMTFIFIYSFNCSLLPFWKVVAPFPNHLSLGRDEFPCAVLQVVFYLMLEIVSWFLLTARGLSLQPAARSSLL